MLTRAAMLVILVAACAKEPPRPATEIAHARVDPALLSQLSVIATAAVPAPDALQTWTDRIARGERTLEDYIDFLLQQPAFSRIVAPQALLGETLVRTQSSARHKETYALRNRPAKDGTPIFYLTEPCKESDAVQVAPWWDLAIKVKVCKDAYRPNVWEMRRGTETVACTAIEASPAKTPGSPCGCGPNLIRCFVDPVFEARVATNNHDELRSTIAYVTEHELPIQTLFSGTHTFRNRGTEWIYRWQQIEGERRRDAAALLRDVANWPEAGKWAERVELAPGQHAGLVTAIGTINFAPDPRQRQWRIFDIMWCTGPASVGVTNESILSLKVHNLQYRNEGWEELARRPVCTTCHARMDYGIQFFKGYPSPVSAASHFLPAMHKPGATGPLFLRDLDDTRGNAPLTPAGFAAAVMAEPEFPTCMAKRFTDAAFGVNTSEADVLAVRDAVFSSKTVTIKAIAKAALLRYAQGPRREEAPRTSTLQAQLQQACGDCHHASADVPDLEVANPSRTLLLHSLDHVASGRMPKDEAMPVAQRLQLVRLLVDTLWTTDAQRREAYDWYAGPLESPATNRWPTLQHAIDELAGIPMTKPWNAAENLTGGDQTAVTPNIGLMSTLEAIRACKLAGKKDAALEACVERATPTDLIAPR